MSATPPTIRIATWNIRAAIGPGEPFPPAWWRHVRRDRFERIGAIVEALDADVVVLQEVAVLTPDGEVFDQPLELGRLTGRHVRYGAVHAFALVDPEDGRSHGVATWGNVLLSRTPIAATVTGLPLGTDDEPVEPAGADHPLAGVPFRDAPTGTREPRCVVAGRIDAAGSTLTVLGTHLAYAGGAQRAAQADAVARIAATADGPVVVAGDLNAAIEDPELRALGALDDAFGAIGIPPGDERRASSGPARIDHLLGRGLRAIECRVVREAGDASDHLPVVATYALPPTA